MLFSSNLIVTYSLVHIMSVIMWRFDLEFTDGCCEGSYYAVLCSGLSLL